MPLLMTKIFLFIAFLGHILCFFCDRAITYTANGRFSFQDLNDNEKLSKLFEGTPLKKQLFSMLGGVLALILTSFGYISIYRYVNDYNQVYGTLLLISFILLIVAGTAHHVFCGVVEWFYIRLGRSEEARKTILEFFKKTISTMYVSFLGVLIFSVTLLIAIASSATGLPWWSCFFNVLPIFLLLFPFRIVGSFNLASALAFLGLFITFCVM